MNPIQIGQGAAAGQAANIGNAANNISNLLTNQGNTLAGITSNEMRGLTGAIGQGANSYMTYNTLQNLAGNNSFNPYLYQTTDVGNINTGLPAIGSFQ